MVYSSNRRDKMLAIDNQPLIICYLAARHFSVEIVPHQIKNPFLKESDWLIRVRSSEPTIVKTLDAESVVEYASCKEDPRSIARFTKKYGPLFPWGERETWRSVERLGSWTSMKYQFQEAWDDLLHLEHRKPSASNFHDEYHALRAEQNRVIASLRQVDSAKQCQASGTFSLTDSGLAFVGESLYAALLVQMYSLASMGRLRRCENPECSLLPYFLSSPDRRKFCNADCANYGKKQAKLAWWNTKGSERRRSNASVESLSKNKKKQLKGERNGTQEAR
jgi:predicted RNA-binding Zn ribbon-like protein